MTKLTHRYKIWLMLEAATPLSVGTGREGVTTDRLVARNASGYPYIPGTGLAGALRAALEAALPERDWEAIWGDKTRKTKIVKGEKQDFTRGSRLIVNSAHLLAADGKTVLEGVPVIPDKSQPFYQILQKLPLRDHVRINDRGAAVKKGKFDEQLCPKGARFVGSLELLGDESDRLHWKQICAELAAPFFRIGGGSRKGFGQIEVIKQCTIICDLTNPESRKAYLEEDNNLQLPTKAWEMSEPELGHSGKYQFYKVSLKPRDFFFFGAGHGDQDVDNTYKTEQIIGWPSGSAHVAEETVRVLIPAASVKGALRHRLAFHYNRLKGITIPEDTDTLEGISQDKLAHLETMAASLESVNAEDSLWDEVLEKINSATLGTSSSSESEEDATVKNPAVVALFGRAANSGDSASQGGKRGQVLFSDVFLSKDSEKIFDHVRIDRFTGGASDGALFQEKTVASRQDFSLEMWVAKAALEEDKNIEDAWHATLLDLCEGRLALGGKTTKGHGYFKGECIPNLRK